MACLLSRDTLVTGTTTRVGLRSGGAGIDADSQELGGARDVVGLDAVEQHR
jgi:hypothetical protein